MTPSNYQLTIDSESQTEQFAGKLAREISAPIWVELKGQLGAGKTTLTRYVLQALGHKGTVKSPTYTLVEPYDVADSRFFHFDLYRLSDPEELEYLGIRDYLGDNVMAFIEWPSKGKDFLPEPDLSIEIQLNQSSRTFELTANSKKGQKIIHHLIASESD